MRGPPPRRSWRFTALDRRAPRAALHRVDFSGRPDAELRGRLGRPGVRPCRRAPPLPDARPLLPGAVHGRARRLDRERRAAVDLGRPRLHAREPRLGRQRLHARVRRLPAARRPRRRPARAARGVRRRPGAVRARLAGRRPRAERADARRRARRAGARRRGRRAGDALDPHDRLHRGPRAQPGARAVGRDGRDRRRLGRAARRPADRDAELALDPDHQRADRAARARSPRCASCAPGGRDAGADAPVRPRRRADA